MPVYDQPYISRNYRLKLHRRHFKKLLQNVKKLKIQRQNKTLNMTGFINRFVFLHRPVKGALEDTVTNPNELDQIFDDYNVTAVFAGHEHYYCRNNTATLYIITGGGGANLHDPNPALCVAYNKTYHFVNITVSGNTIYGNAINMSNGAVLDTFSWTTPS